MLNSEPIKNAFIEAKSRYASLQHANIILTFRKELFFTMRATVIFSSFFNKKRTYIVVVNTSKSHALSQLSQDDLIGWIGHELAHIVEYETMTNKELVLFFVKYIFNLKFRFFVERRVNALACNNGFAKELFQTFKKFSSLEGFGAHYKRYLLKHYIPAWSDIKQSSEQQGITESDYHKAMQSARK